MARNSSPEAPLIPPRPTRIAAAETPKAALASPVVIAGVIVAALYVGREIFIPIAIAVLFSFVLGPLVDLLRRLRLGRIMAVAIAVITALGIVAALTTLIGVQVADLAGDVPRYRDTIERKVEGLKDSALGRATDYVANIGRAIHQAGSEGEVGNKPAPSAAGPEKPEEKAVLVEMRERPPGPIETAGTLLSPVMKPLATTGIVFVVLLFILMQKEDLRDRMIRLAGSSDLHRTTVAMDDAARRLSRYFVVQLALNAAFGIVIGAGLYLIGVPNPVLWGIFSALMRFVPYVGAFLSALFPLALAAAVDPGWNMVVATATLFVVLEPIVGHIIEPMLYGQSTGLSPFAVLVSALFWTWLWGPVGLLLSTPLTVCLVVLGRHVDRLEFLDVLFGDRPALTPIENFYQRILADDPEEVQEHADLILQECSLSAYYDEVVLRGLELAARDAARGVLTPEQKTAIRASVTELVEELSSRADETPEAPAAAAHRLVTGGERNAPACGREPITPAPGSVGEAWRREGAVLCVAGRGFVDGAAAAILAQLLEKRGIGTRIVPFSEVARARIDAFSPGPARIACIISLAISGEPTHLRRLVGRLRRRMPQVRIVAGLWRADDEILGDAARLAALGADENVISLRAAVEAVLAAVEAEPRALSSGRVTALSASGRTEPERANSDLAGA
ncbi:putative PurR-regulated permease PerM [Methylobacterium sp. BE186]|uniref:AI-2E family transporter n=1 Tax=Methylobacterium sp. BE186 TaxID=2817715 RepID=UPI0028590B90|nr:AI-2E family transporter [Methylobacterium sp. BE186]MDR7037075.1 putative PurR-regulated permease PerM [Methylobacterium sp. BE186]